MNGKSGISDAQARSEELTLITARHRPAPARGTFRSIHALVFESAGAWLRCVRSSERLQNSLGVLQMLLSDSLPRGGFVIYPQGNNVCHCIHAVAVDE
jgi:hypothetical protein